MCVYIRNYHIVINWIFTILNNKVPNVQLWLRFGDFVFYYACDLVPSRVFALIELVKSQIMDPVLSLIKVF